MIPQCLTLTPGQKQKLDEFVKSLKTITIEEHDDAFGGACMTSRIEFICWDTSIGFNLDAVDNITGARVSLLTDEDIENV